MVLLCILVGIIRCMEMLECQLECEAIILKCLVLGWMWNRLRLCQYLLWLV